MFATVANELSEELIVQIFAMVAYELNADESVDKLSPVTEPVIFVAFNTPTFSTLADNEFATSEGINALPFTYNLYAVFVEPRFIATLRLLSAFNASP
jgi:hypothetical protein